MEVSVGDTLSQRNSSLSTLIIDTSCGTASPFFALMFSTFAAYVSFAANTPMGFGRARSCFSHSASESVTHGQCPDFLTALRNSLSRSCDHIGSSVAG